MNISAVIGGVLAWLLLLYGILVGSSVWIFVDFVSFVLVIFGGVAFLLQAHGRKGVALTWMATKAWLSGNTDQWSASDLQEAATVCESAAQGVILIGWIASMIGLVQILQNIDLDHLDAFGPATAVMVLTIFYALIWKLLFWLPLAAG